jgi:hypothetical protein
VTQLFDVSGKSMKLGDQNKSREAGIRHIRWQWEIGHKNRKARLDGMWRGADRPLCAVRVTEGSDTAGAINSS